MAKPLLPPRNAPRSPGSSVAGQHQPPSKALSEAAHLPAAPASPQPSALRGIRVRNWCRGGTAGPLTPFWTPGSFVGPLAQTKPVTAIWRLQAMGSSGEPLGPLCRWYIYAIHGYFSEVMFTATWDFVLEQDWKFRGVTSVWALFIYGTCGLALEQLYLHLKAVCRLPARGALYTACIYLWEFATGYLLRCFGACPWDYSHFRYNLLGLVTLEYCVFWYVGALLLEQLVIRNVLQLRRDVARKPGGDQPIASFRLKDD